MTQSLYCGLDIHKDKYVACLLNQEGNELRNGSFSSTKDAITQFFSGINNTFCTVIIENCGMWRYAYKIPRTKIEYGNHGEVFYSFTGKIKYYRKLN